MATLVLGSASPRRAQLLGQLGLPFDQCVAHIDETPARGEAPDAYVQRMAREKAAAIEAAASRAGEHLLLTADTTVVVDGDSLGKPGDRGEARAMLARLSGRAHEVHTAVCLTSGSSRAETLVTTRVSFMPLAAALIEAYLDTEEPWDKAGAYAIQGLAGSFVSRIEGSVSNVIGLPLVETRALLEAAGLEPRIGNSAP